MLPIRVLVVDDSLMFRKLLVKALNADPNIEVVADVADVYEARDAILKFKPDVMTLDVEMPKMNGMELAKHIRARLPMAMIIFLTSHSEFSMEGYKFSALRYIPKLDMARQLPEALAAVQAEFAKLESRFLTVRRYSDMMRIPYQEIVYVHHVLRTSEITTLNLGVIKDNRGLKEIHGQLGDERFIYIDRSTFVNLDHIRQIKGSEVILRNSEHLPISRQMLTKVKYTINHMWGD